jgi:hypothetical protein
MHEAMERGNAKRPLIVVPNDSIFKQWVETIFETIPNAKVNVLGNLGKIMISQNLITKTEKLPLLLMKVLIILVFQKILLKIWLPSFPIFQKMN